jgi:hypothetical protein
MADGDARRPGAWSDGEVWASGGYSRVSEEQKKCGTSLRGSVTTNTFSVSAKAGGQAAAKVGAMMDNTLPRLEDYMAVMRNTQDGRCTHRS